MNSKNNTKSSEDDLIRRLGQLDAKGLICPPAIPPATFVDNADTTLAWARSIDQKLQETGKVEVMGEEFSSEQAVPGAMLRECLQPARESYGITPGWVPAFFTKKLLPWYVGGACFYFFDDNVLKVCFLLSHHFRRRRRWLLYSRDEIISHEICHVARAMMDQTVFEEPLAYRISNSGFRRGFGPMFRGAWEAPALLGSSLILLAGSAARAVGAANLVQHLTYIPLAATVGVLTMRAWRAHSILKKAIRKLEGVYGPEAGKVAFRCTDREIIEIAGSADVGELIGQYSESARQRLRWTVVDRRFGRGNARRK